MPSLSKLVAIHAVIGNAPRIISVEATAGFSPTRTFNGTGVPSVTTLAAGNSKYNAAASGYVVNASLAAAGSGYVVGDILAMTDTCATHMQITVDMVNSSGAIIDFHINQVANCSSYPALPVASTDTTGSGTGATFNLNFPAPDRYLDITTPIAPIEYVCTTSGSNSTSVWAKISGGGGVFVAYDITGATAYNGGDEVYVASQVVCNGITVLPGTYRLLSSVSVPISPGGNQIPQIPIPSVGVVYWIPIAAGLVTASTCASGTTETIFINSTGLI